MDKEVNAIKDGEQQRLHKSIMSLIEMLRSITRILKLFPFVYSLTIVFLSPLYFFDNGDITDILDNLFYVSPFVIILLFVLSYHLKLCNWYRIQCSLPLLPQCLGIVDSYVYEFGENTACAVFFAYVTIFTLSLVNAYFVFIRKPHLHRQG